MPSRRWNPGCKAPSAEWKVHYALMLGLERVIADHPARLASGTELRRHQIDALAGMLTELISRNERHEENGNGLNGDDEDFEDELDEPVAVEVADDDDDLEPEVKPEDDPGAERRFRFRHPTASGKTIAAAGFVEAARTMGILILTHRRLLVNQFTTDLTTEGYGGRFRPAIETGSEPLAGNPITIQTYAWFARHVGTLSRTAYQLVICDEAHTALGEKTSAAIRSFPEPLYVGMTATEQLIAKQVSDVFPASVDDLPARRRRTARADRPAPLTADSSGGRHLVGADRRRRLRPGGAGQGARPRADQPGGREPLPRPLLRDAGNRLRGRRRARLQPGAGVPRGRAEGRGGERQDTAAQAGRDAGRLRARRDQRPRERPASRRGLELTARDGLHAPRAHGQPPRVPAAHRSRHAHASPQGGRRRRRLRRSGRDPQRPHGHDPLAARLGLLPAGRASHAGAAAASPEARTPQALAGGLARPGHVGSAPPRPRDPAGVGADQPRQARRRRADALGGDRGPPAALRRAAAVRREAGQGVEGMPRGVPHELRGREPEPQAAALRAGRPRRHLGRPRELRRSRLHGHARRRPGRRTACTGSGSCSARSARGRPRRPTTSCRAGRGSSRGRPASSRTGARARIFRTRSGSSARSRTRAVTGTRRTRRGSSTSRWSSRSTSARHCSHRPRPTRRPRSA